MQELELLNGKLEVLIRRYAALKTENDRLRGTVRQQTTELELLNARLQQLEQQLAAMQIGAALSEPADREAVRRQLDAMIGEIDKILTSLND